MEESQTERNATDAVTSRARYEEKNKMLSHGFPKDWMKEYQWLKYNEEEGKMYCTVCKD